MRGPSPAPEKRPRAASISPELASIRLQVTRHGHKSEFVDFFMLRLPPFPLERMRDLTSGRSQNSHQADQSFLRLRLPPLSSEIITEFTSGRSKDSRQEGQSKHSVSPSSWVLPKRFQVLQKQKGCRSFRKGTSVQKNLAMKLSARMLYYYA